MASSLAIPIPIPILAILLALQIEFVKCNLYKLYDLLKKKHELNQIN